jgi:hypothetical protein
LHCNGRESAFFIPETQYDKLPQAMAETPFWGKHKTCGEGIYPRPAAQQSQNLQMRCVCKNAGGGFATHRG